MESDKGKVRIYKNGLVANDIHLVLKKWIINESDISTILSDKNTAFASLRNVAGTKDTTQCRKLMGLSDNVDLAFIFTITMTNTRLMDKEVVTSWIGSDLQDCSIKILIRGELTPDLRRAQVGTVCALLNPDIKANVIESDLKSITIKQPDEILVIGQLDGLVPCKGVTTKGDLCKNLVYVHNQGEFCKYHVKFGRKTKKPQKAQNEVPKPTTKVIPNLFEPESKPISFMEPNRPTNQEETINKLGDLNFLMQKIITKRSSSNLSTASTALSSLELQKPKPRVVQEKPKEFEKLVSLIAEYLSKDSKEYNKVLGTLQLLTRKLEGVTVETITRTKIVKMCDFLLDHPVENIAISALKLRRSLKRILSKSCSLRDGEVRVTGANSGPDRKRSEKTPKSPTSKQKVLEELDTLMGLSSNVDTIVEKEKGLKLNEKLRALEKLDRNEEFKQTIKFIEVPSYFCEKCSLWSESVNPYCRQEGHKLVQKRVKKEWHVCVNKLCKYRYYSLDGQKPALCPKCRETTFVSETSSFYKPRPERTLPNEKLLDCEPGASRPLNSDS